MKRTYKREVKHVSVTVFEEYPVAMANQQVGWVSVIPAPDSNHVQIRLASAYVGTGGAQHLRVEYDNYDTPNDESWDGWHTSSSCSATYAVGAALDRFNPLISVNYDMSGLYIRYLHNSHSRRTAWWQTGAENLWSELSRQLTRHHVPESVFDRMYYAYNVSFWDRNVFRKLSTERRQQLAMPLRSMADKTQTQQLLVDRFSQRAAYTTALWEASERIGRMGWFAQPDWRLYRDEHVTADLRAHADATMIPQIIAPPQLCGPIPQMYEQEASAALIALDKLAASEASLLQ